MAKPPGRRRFTKTPRNRRREVTDGNTSEDSKHPSSDSSESSGGGVSLRPSMCSNGHKNAEDTRGPDTDDDAVGPSQHSSPLGSTSHRNSSQKYSLLWSGSGTLPSPRLGGQPDDSMAKKTSSTSDWALEVSSMISTSRPASPDNTTLIQPIKPSSISVPGSPQARASSPTPNWIMLGGGTTPVAIHGPDQQEHTHHTNTAEATSNQTARPRGPYVAYVEDATDSEEEVFHTDSLDSLAVETGNIGDYRHPTASREQPEQSRFFDDEEQSTSSPVARSPSSHSYSDYSDDWTPDELHEESNTEETQRRPVRRSLRKSVPTPYQSSSSEDMNHTRSRPKHGRAFRRRILRPRRTNTPDLQNYPNPPRSFAPNAPASRYAPPPSSYQGYGPYPGLYVPPYAPSAPIQSYEPPFAPYNPYYSQYTDAHAPSGYPNYVHYQRENPAYFTPNPNYSQPPPPPSTIIPEPPTKPLPLDPGTSKLTPRQEPENAFHIASAIKTALSYNPPTSSDPSGHEISFQIPLKCPSAPDNPGKQKSVMFGAPYGGEMSGHWDLDSSAYRQSGKSYLTRIQSLEYYVDRSSQGRITILPSQLTDTTTSDGGRELRWLHLQHDTLCISHLRELIRNCRYIDEDLRSLTDGFLEVECTRFEKKYSVGSRHGYYIEPGTVLRCDVRCDQEPDRGTKSVFFCSVPYLQLGKHGGSNDNGEEADMRLHPARTLMESLYDYDLPDDRDNRQAILRCLSPEQESILYIPQTWYILCGSEILISYSQLSLDEIRGDSIKAQDESSGSLIAFVTDLDNNQFSVALKPTDSYFSVRASIEALRSNASGNTIHDYDLVLDNDEHLIAKNWLDIVDRDPLPSLKITLKSRSKTDKRSLALIVRDKNFWPAKKFIADSSASDDDNKSQSSSPQRALATRALNLEKRDRPHSKSLSSQRRAPAHAYALTSYKGSTNVLEADANDLTGSDIAQHHEHFDESYTPTLVDSLQLRQENDRRRIQEFDSRGIIINDILSVSNEPEVFQVTEKAPETGSKPTVWDYLVNKWDVESSSPDDQGDVERDRGSQDVSTSTAGPNSSTIVNDNTQTVKKDSTIEPPDIGRSQQVCKQPLHHHMQWSRGPFLGGSTDKDHVGGDYTVRRVLDQVHDSLLKNSEHFKRYAKSYTNTLETLKDPESPLHATIDKELLDEILSFRRKVAKERKNRLFNSSENLVRMFIPLDFDHEATRKIWGAIHRICETLDSILRSDQCNSGDSYLVQDYSGDSDLLHSAALTKPEIPMEGCTQCSGGFTNLGDGIAHLSSVHFSSNSTALPDSASEKLRLWLRTPDQVQLEARIHTFLTFMEECIGAFEKLIKVADDLRLGSISVGDTGGVGGYPVIESLVRVFEHITIILVFACDFMVKAEKAMRKDHRKALNGKKFRGQFKVSLHRIIQGAQKNLEQAKIDMILASRTERRQGVVTLASIGPELIIAMISNGLFFRKLGGTQGISTSSGGNVDGDNVNTEDIDVGEVYKMYANKLQLQVNQRPQKRLLPDIYALEEELDILHRLNRWQRKFCLDFLRVLDPSSYKITTKARFSHFKTEDRYLRKTLRRLEVRGSELHSLQQRTEKLRDQLRQNIEIEEESHGKAIRVFTFVTIFFLPLSFVTSFFGMNTVDIRNIDQDQRLFWIVSVPTTAFVIGIAYLYGYKWEHWKERFSRPRGSRVINPATEHAVRILQPFGLRRLLQETTNKDDLEKGGFRRQESGFSLRSIESVKDKARRPMHLWRNRNSK